MNIKRYIKEEMDDFEWIKKELKDKIYVEWGEPIKIVLCDSDNISIEEVIGKMEQLYPTEEYPELQDNIDHIVKAIKSRFSNEIILYLEGPEHEDRYEFLEWDICEHIDEYPDYKWILSGEEFLNVHLINDEPINESDDFEWMRGEPDMIAHLKEVGKKYGFKVNVETESLPSGDLSHEIRIYGDNEDNLLFVMPVTDNLTYEDIIEGVKKDYMDCKFNNLFCTHYYEELYHSLVKGINFTGEDNLNESDDFEWI